MSLDLHVPPSSPAPASDTTTLLVLHRLRIAGRVPADRLPVEAATLSTLAELGLLRVSERGVTLTGAGLRHHAELLNAEREKVDVEELARAYEQFLRANQPVKDACALWQARGPASSEEDVVSTLDRLEALMDRARPSFARAARAVPRFAEYPQRLEGALDRVGDGHAQFLTDPAVDSFHTVWFECHEDYLLTLGREREDEEREHDNAR